MEVDRKKVIDKIKMFYEKNPDGIETKVDLIV